MFETWLGHWRIIRIYLHQSSLSTTWLWSSKSPNGWTWDIFWKESVWGATSVHPTTLEQRQLLPLWLICTYLKGNSQISIWYHDQATQPVTIWNNPKNKKKKENVLPLPCTILLGLGLYFSLSFGVVLYDGGCSCINHGFEVSLLLLLNLTETALAAWMVNLNCCWTFYGFI
jgi:hypothetical protein